LGQLQKGHRNVLVLDLTAKCVHSFMIDAYKNAATQMFARHSELSACLIIWRSFTLQPAPSRQSEIYARYIVIPSNNLQATQLPPQVLAALETPGLLRPGRQT
jgi:hypothetical protein